MAADPTDVHELAASFALARDPATAVAILERRAQALGSSLISVGRFQPASRGGLSIICPRGPTDYFQRYVEQRYDRVSPVVAQLRSGPMPFMWSEVHNDRRANPRGQRCMDEARDAGLVDALCVPMRDAGGALEGWVTFFADRINGFDAQVRQNLQSLAVAGHTQLQRLSELALAPHQLTLAQREVLHGLLDGQSSEGLSALFGVSPRTIEHLISAAGRRLGAGTRQQTLEAALRSGELSEAD